MGVGLGVCARSAAARVCSTTPDGVSVGSGVNEGCGVGLHVGRGIVTVSGMSVGVGGELGSMVGDGVTGAVLMMVGDATGGICVGVGSPPPGVMNAAVSARRSATTAATIAMITMRTHKGRQINHLSILHFFAGGRSDSSVPELRAEIGSASKKESGGSCPLVTSTHWR